MNNAHHYDRQHREDFRQNTHHRNSALQKEKRSFTGILTAQNKPHSSDPTKKPDLPLPLN